MKTLAICISSHNNYPYIYELLDNLKKQYDFIRNDVEIIVYDDNSEQKHQEKLKILCEEFTFIESPTWHRSPAFGRNLMRNAVKNSTKYILFIDGDDNIIGDLMDLVVELKTLDDDMLLSFAYFLSEEDELSDCNVKYSNELYTVEDQIFQKNSVSYAIHQTGIWNVYKTDFLAINDIEFPTHIRSEDHYFTHQVLSLKPSIGRLRTRYYGWRLNEKSHSNSENVSVNNLRFLEESMETISNFDKDIVDEIVFNIFNTVLSNVIRGYPKLAFRERRKYFYTCKKQLSKVEYHGSYENTDIYFKFWYKYKFKSFFFAEFLYRVYKIIYRKS